MCNVLGQVICWRPISSFFICFMNLFISLYYTFHINILLTYYDNQFFFMNKQGSKFYEWAEWLENPTTKPTTGWLGPWSAFSIFWSVLGWFGLWLVWTFVCTRECVGPHQWEQFVVHTRERGQIVAHTEMIVVNIIVLAPLRKAQVSCLMDF
jgi:hypothetical protein